VKPWLYVGAKVAFIGGIERSNKPQRWGTMVAMLDPNQTYTVRDIRVFGEIAHRIKGDPIGIHLEEVCNPVADLYDTGSHEPYYPIMFFRPISTIDTTKTVEALKKLVEPNELLIAATVEWAKARA